MLSDVLLLFFSSRLGKNTMDKIIEQGAGAAGIRGSDLAKLEVPYIGYSKQKEIADSLYSFDQKSNSTPKSTKPWNKSPKPCLKAGLSISTPCVPKPKPFQTA